MKGGGGSARSYGLVLKQIVSNERSLNGLAEDGSVWVYVGDARGWKRLNMNIAEGSVGQDTGRRGMSSRAPQGWGPSHDDDIPF